MLSPRGKDHDYPPILLQSRDCTTRRKRNKYDVGRRVNKNEEKERERERERKKLTDASTKRAEIGPGGGRRRALHGRGDF